MTALAELAVILLTMSMEPARLMAIRVGVAVASMVITSAVIM